MQTKLTIDFITPIKFLSFVFFKIAVFDLTSRFVTLVSIYSTLQFVNESDHFRHATLSVNLIDMEWYPPGQPYNYNNDSIRRTFFCALPLASLFTYSQCNYCLNNVDRDKRDPRRCWGSAVSFQLHMKVWTCWVVLLLLWLINLITTIQSW